MKNDALPIEDTGLKLKKNLRYPVWPGRSASAIKSFEKEPLLLEKSDYGTSMQDDASSIEHIEPEPAKKNPRYPVWPWPPAAK